MAEEGMISMNEFKTVLEEFRSERQKIVEVMTHNFARVDEKMQSVMEQIGLLHEGQTAMRADIRLLQEGQTALQMGQSEMRTDIRLLQEGQTALQAGQAEIRVELKNLADGQEAIRSDLRKKADYEDLVRLETRVTRLENKVA